MRKDKFGPRPKPEFSSDEVAGWFEDSVGRGNKEHDKAPAEHDDGVAEVPGGKDDPLGR